MPLLIDCYNLLHEPMPPSLAGLDTAQLCTLLARTKWRHEGITVVCDGQVGPLGLTDSPVPEVTLRYSGKGRIADDLIEEIINADSAPRRLIVVSTDHAVRRAAKRRRAASWTSRRFIQELLGALGSRAERPSDAGEPPGQQPGVSGSGVPGALPGALPGAGALPGGEVRRWLEEFGFDAHESDDESAARDARSPADDRPPPREANRPDKLDDLEHLEHLEDEGDLDDLDLSPHWPPW